MIFGTTPIYALRNLETEWSIGLLLMSHTLIVWVPSPTWPHTTNSLLMLLLSKFIEPIIRCTTKEPLINLIFFLSMQVTIISNRNLIFVMIVEKLILLELMEAGFSKRLNRHHLKLSLVFAILKWHIRSSSCPARSWFHVWMVMAIFYNSTC
jgi:hypothetical protein